jgi:hypothetical protein
MTDMDYKILEKLKITLIDSDLGSTDLMEIQHKQQRQIWLPVESKRAYFWYIHSRTHLGLTKIVEQLRMNHILWHNAVQDIQAMLSQCICAIKKDARPKPYSEEKHIVARHTMHILSIDLFSYSSRLYFTSICIFSKFAWVKEIPNAEAATVLKTYKEFCASFGKPSLISCDNGTEFNLIDTTRISNPSYHPQANGVVERFHLELAKQSRIHNVFPDQAVHFINSDQSCELMSTHRLNDALVFCVFQYATREFQYNDMVWRHVVKRARAKHEDTFTGPHRVLSSLGKFSYQLTSHQNVERKIQVNINSMKKFLVPENKGWKLNEEYFQNAVNELNVEVRNPEVWINFSALDSFVQDVLDGKLNRSQFFVVPDWPCATWYKRLHRQIKAEAVRLPNKEDLFLDEKNRPLGVFAWDNWLFALDAILVKGS